MHFLIERFRAIRRWLLWLRRVRTGDIAGAERLFAEQERRTPPVLLFPDGAFLPPSACPIPLPNCKTCGPETVDYRELGRGELTKSSISEVAAWLETEGWAGEDAGRLQVVAAWLIKRREAYERNGAAIS